MQKGINDFRLQKLENIAMNIKYVYILLIMLCCTITNKKNSNKDYDKRSIGLFCANIADINMLRLNINLQQRLFM